MSLILLSCIPSCNKWPTLHYDPNHEEVAREQYRTWVLHFSPTVTEIRPLFNLQTSTCSTSLKNSHNEKRRAQSSVYFWFSTISMSMKFLVSPTVTEIRLLSNLTKGLPLHKLQHSVFKFDSLHFWTHVNFLYLPPLLRYKHFFLKFVITKNEEHNPSLKFDFLQFWYLWNFLYLQPLLRYHKTCSKPLKNSPIAKSEAKFHRVLFVQDVQKVENPLQVRIKVVYLLYYIFVISGLICSA